MKHTALDLQIHLETLRLIDTGRSAPDARAYMLAAQQVAGQLDTGDFTQLNRLARGQDAALRELAANSLFNRQGWLPESGAAAAAQALCAFTDVWRRVSGRRTR